MSVTNINDFSWRNRLTAWWAGIRMMSDSPVFGFGWGQVERVFAESYRPPRLEETSAIQLNDFLTLGLSAGVPSFLFFVCYLGLSLFPCFSVKDAFKNIGPPCEYRFPLFRAVSLLMLIGFFFDGGLFRFATGPLFWLFVEFSRDEKGCSQPQMERRPTDSKQSLFLWETAMRGLAVPLGLVAVAITAFHVFLPRFEIGSRTLYLARAYIVAPKDRTTFDYLATNSIWVGKPLCVLLEHLELADYTRDLVSWKLHDYEFCEYVLSPQIDVDYDDELSWRRPLWEFFYPRIRSQPDIPSAVRIIRELVHEQITLSPQRVSGGILTMWERRTADRLGFEVLFTGTLRSVGIPARLSDQQDAEFLLNDKWIKAE
jgi:hypothetical protein